MEGLEEAIEVHEMTIEAHEEAEWEEEIQADNIAKVIGFAQIARIKTLLGEMSAIVAKLQKTTVQAVAEEEVAVEVVKIVEVNCFNFMSKNV